MPEKAGCTLYQRFYHAVNEKDMGFLNPNTVDQNKAGLNDPYGAFTANIYGLTPRLIKQPISHPTLLKPGWTRVLNIRHPFDRLYSGWRDKFNPNNHDCDRFVRKFKPAIDRYEENQKHIKIGLKTCKNQTGMMVTFQAFLRYIVDIPFNQVNQHFLPINHICTPCDILFSEEAENLEASSKIEWDIISTQGTVADDIFQAFELIMSKSENPDDLPFVNQIKENRKNLTSLKEYKKKKIAKEKFFEVCQKDRGRDLIEKYLYKKYEWDFLIFGYTLEGYLC